MRSTVILLSVVLSFCVSSLNATTIHVPADSATIQAGINGAVDGDTVLVADGTYTGDGNWDIDFLGKAIMVMSENGAENCVIDCENIFGHHGFYFHNAEDSNSVLKGVTIRNVYLGTGGGISCEYSSPTIMGNIIMDNYFYVNGGGIYCFSASPRIIGNTITGNSARWDEGGGIYCLDSSTLIIKENAIIGNGFAGINCYEFSSLIIKGNTITQNDGCGIFCESVIPSTTTIEENAITENSWKGIHCNGSSSQILNNIISGNEGGDGAGVYCGHASAIIRSNQITDNWHVSHFFGGSGICLEECSGVVEDNTLSGNLACGGTILYVHSSNTLKGNMIYENEACFAGGVYFVESSPIAAGNTIVGNTAGSASTGGIHCYYSYPIITTSILRNNLPDEIYCEESEPLISYSNIQGGWDGDGNIDEDPLFVDPENDNYHLLPDSPCIDTGHPELPCRPWGGWCLDMGAYEYDQGFYWDGQNLILKPFPIELPLTR